MPTEIIPKLWIGNKKDVELEFIKSRHITCLINCTCSHDSPGIIDFEQMGINYIKVPVSENISSQHDNEIMLKQIPIVIDSIHQKLITGNAILIYCHTGKQRAPTIITAYLMKYGKVNLKTAIKYIQSKQEKAFTPMMYFYMALEKYNKV